MSSANQQPHAAWNATAREYRLDRTVHQLFEEQVDRTPQAIALEFEGVRLTYAELDRRANQLAHRLRRAVSAPDALVAICMDRSIEMVVALLGVLKADAAYVPVDPAYPVDRVDFMLKDSSAAAVLTQAALRERVAAAGSREVICLDSDWAEIAKESSARPSAAVSPTSLAYVIYTSGSTGRPKGVAIPHIALSNHMQWLLEAFPMTSADRVLQKTPFSFDASVWEFYAPLLCGGQLVIARPGGHADPSYLVEVVASARVTVLQLVPSVLRALVEHPGFGDCKTLRHVFCGGEALLPELQRAFFSRSNATLCNLYGPTEATIDATYWVCDRSAPPGPVPIGRPIANMKAYVLDERGELAAPGTVGELYLGGVGLARGYLGRPDLTAERFTIRAGDPGVRLYRTGDLVEWSKDGVLVYHGRVDNQVKVRGFRIELEEIEAALSAHPAVRGCAVVARADRPGEQRLVAYVVGEVGVPALREHLGAKLPDYMVPSVFVSLPALPLTANGKVDRAKLPEPPTAGGGERAAPRTPLEHLIAEAWATALRLDVADVDIDADFYESGGDSLQAAMLIVELTRRLDVVLYVTAVFDAPSIAALANYLIDNYPELAARFASGARPHKTSQLVDATRLAEFKRHLIPLKAGAAPRGAKKNRSMAFLLSAPRSGSTLLRVMLAGHPKLFVPPECELLSFTTLQERKAALAGRDHWIAEGTIRALMEIYQCDVHRAKAMMEKAEADGLTTHQFYAQLQDALGERILVDKTTTYALDLPIIERAEAEFTDAKYIHLTRHPYGMIRSFEEVRMDQIFLHGGRWSCDDPRAFTTRELGEMVWTTCSENITSLLQHVPTERKHHVRFEDLVSQPKIEMERLCAFLGVDLVADMLDPYTDGKRRMTDGVHGVAESKMIGDVSFFTHKTIEPVSATTWTRDHKDDYLGELAWGYAQEFGYRRDSPVPR